MPAAHAPDLVQLSVGVNSYRLAAPDVRAVGLRTNQLRFDNLGSDPQVHGTTFPRPAEDFLVASRLASTREAELSAMDYFGDVMATTIAQTDDDPVADADLIRLPRGAGAPLTLEEALHRRRSIRRFSGDPLRLDQVATLLRLGDGVSAEAEIELLRGGSVLHHFRTAPSGGGLYPVELLLVALSVNGLDPGVYRYAPLRDALVRVAGRGVLNGVQDAFSVAAGAIALDTASAILLLTAHPWRAMRKYGPRGLRFVLHEGGSITQNVHLAATSLGLGSTDCASYADDVVHAALGMDGVQTAVIHTVVLGWRG